MCGLHSSAICRSIRSAMLATRDLQQIHRHAGMSAVEIAAVQTLAGGGIEQRIVVGTVDFGFQQRANEGEGIEQHADDMRGAADGIMVLDSAVVFGLAAGIFDVLGDPAVAGELAGMGLGQEEALIEMPAVAVQNIGWPSR